MKDRLGKGLLCDVFRCALGDCTNCGVSSKHNSVILSNVAPDARVFEVHEGCPELVLCPGLGDQKYRAVPRDFFDPEVPFRPDGRPNLVKWAMFGGNFVYTSDSRLREITPYPIPVHDRFER